MGGIRRECGSASLSSLLISLSLSLIVIVVVSSSAGSVFLGQWTPESVGDYASGTNHVLPTYGYARMYGGVALDSFLKHMTVQSLTPEGLRRLGPFVAKMAEVEGLEAHRRAVTLRLRDIAATAAATV